MRRIVTAGGGREVAPASLAIAHHLAVNPGSKLAEDTGQSARANDPLLLPTMRIALRLLVLISAVLGLGVAFAWAWDHSDNHPAPAIDQPGAQAPITSER